MERLKDAGIPMDRGIPKCNNCNGRIPFQPDTFWKALGWLTLFAP